MIGQCMVKKCDKMLSRFHLIPERYGQTNIQTDGQNCYINNNNNNHDNVYGAVIMAEPLREFTRFI